MFELRSKTKWYSPLESDLLFNPPPLWNFLGLWPPPPPWNFQFPPWWGSGYFLELAHIVWKYIFYCYVLNKNKNIVNAGYWVLSENPRNFGCNISIRRPSIQSLAGREGNKVSACRGVGYVIFSWREIVQEAIFVKFKNLFTLQTSSQVFHSIRILWPWCSVSSKWFRKNCYHNGSTKWKYTAAIKIFLVCTKSSGWPWGWQIPELWAMQNLLMLHPQDWKPTVAQGVHGSTWNWLMHSSRTKRPWKTVENKRFHCHRLSANSQKCNFMHFLLGILQPKTDKFQSASLQL